MLGYLSNISVNVGSNPFITRKDQIEGKTWAFKKVSEGGRPSTSPLGGVSQGQFKARQVPRSMYERPGEELKLQSLKNQKQQLLSSGHLQKEGARSSERMVNINGVNQFRSPSPRAWKGERKLPKPTIRS